MPKPASPAIVSAWQDLHSRMGAWTAAGGTPAEARELVAALRALPRLDGAPGDDRVSALSGWLKAKPSAIPERGEYPAAACWVAGQPPDQWPWRQPGAAAWVAYQLDVPAEASFWSRGETPSC